MRLQLTRGLVIAMGLAAGSPALAKRPRVEAAAEVAVYTDTDHVTVSSPSGSITVGSPGGSWSVGGHYLLDAVSAASVDIVATATPRWQEYRHVGGLNLSFKKRGVQLTASGSVSSEPDYLSFSAGAQLSVELVDKNFVPFVGFSYGHDDVGRTGLDRARWELLQRFQVQGGATFVINRSVIASLQLDVDLERGYLAKPYRYIPVFAPGTGREVPAGASVAQVNDLRLDERPVDSLPHARDRYALTGRIAGRVGRTTLRLDERVYTDSWGMWASTTEARVLVDATKRVLVWPQLRYHGQSAIAFWQRAYEVIPLADGTTALPSLRTGDRELSTLHTITLGLGLKAQLTRLGRTPWFLSVLVSGAYTRYPDALYITQRWSVFSSMGLSVVWE